MVYGYRGEETSVKILALFRTQYDLVGIHRQGTGWRKTLASMLEAGSSSRDHCEDKTELTKRCCAQGRRAFPEACAIGEHCSHTRAWSLEVDMRAVWES